MLRSRSHHALEAALRRVWLRTVPRAAPSGVPLTPQNVGAYALAADGVGGRGIHTSSIPPLAGRRDGNAPSPRLKNWKKYLSKRAKKRHRGKLEKWAKHANRGALVKASKALPPMEKMEEDRRMNRMLVDVLKHEAAGPPTPRQELQAVDADEYAKAIQLGVVKPTRSNYTQLLRVYGAQGRFADATATMQTMIDAGVGVDPYVYGALATACASVGNPDAAFDVIDMMKETGMRPTEHVYGSAITACLNAEDLPRAFNVLERMTADGITLTAPIFTHLITGLNQRGMYKRAWEVFDHMRQNHCEPDAVTMSAMITTCARCDEVERAINLVTEMKQMQMQPTHVTYNAVIHAAARSFRRFTHAQELFDEMRANGYKPDTFSYASLLLSCSHTGQITRAKEIMHEMYADGIKPNVYVFNNLLTVYARSMTQLKGKPPAVTTFDRADGRDLLKPPPKPENLEELGHGMVLVDGDEDTIANNLLIDYYNDPSKKSYNDYLEAVADTRADEIDKSAKDVALHPEAVQGMEDPRDRMQAEHQQLEEMKQALEDGDGMFAGLTAALDWHKYLNESEDPDEVKDSVDRLLGDTDWDDLSDAELDRRYKEFVNQRSTEAKALVDELADESRPTLLEQGVAALTASDGGHSARQLFAGLTSSKLSVSASGTLDGGDGASNVTESARSMGHAGDGLTMEELRARAHGRGLSDGGYSGDDDDDAYDGTESEEDGVVGTLARPGEVKEGFVRRRRAGMVSRGAMSEAIYRDVIEQVSVEGVLPADAPEQDGADMPLLLTPDAQRALQTRVSTGPGSSPGVNVEDALVTAVEDPLSRTIRGGAQPATLRALLAVQQLEQKGAFEAVASSSTAGSLGDAVIPGTEEALRLQTLKRLARKFAGGAHWLPSPMDPDVNRARVNLVHEVDAVYKYMQEEQGVQPDQVTANAIVLALANANQPKKAYKFLENEFAKHDLNPDERTYRALISMHVKRRELDRAVELKEEMLSRGVKPSKDAMGLLVHGHAKSNNLRSAFDTLDEMFRLDLECPEHHAFLLREKCKAMGVWHPLVPAHPYAWQFTKRVTKMRKAVDKRTRKGAQDLKSKKSFMGS